MGSAIVRYDFVGNVIDRARQKIEVIREQGCRECHFKIDTAAAEGIMGLCGLYVDRFLHGCFRETGLFVPFGGQSEIQQCIPAPVEAISSYDIASWV